MTKGPFVQTMFNGGEFSPSCYGAVGLPTRPSSLALCENMIPRLTGGIQRRGGLYFVKPADSAVRSRQSTVSNGFAQSNLWHYTQSDQPSIFVEAHSRGISYFDSEGRIGHLYEDLPGVYNGDALSVSNPNITVDYTGSPYDIVIGDMLHLMPTGVPGAYPTYLQDLFCRVISIITTPTQQILSLDLGDTYLYQTPSPYISTIPITFSVVYTKPYPSWFNFTGDTYQNLSYVDYIQDKDTLFLVCPGKPPTTLARISDSLVGDPFIWTRLTLNDGPYLSINSTTTGFLWSSATVANGATVNVSPTSTVGINGGFGFYPSDVRRLIRQQGTDNNWYWFQIESVNTPTNATVRCYSKDGAANLPTTVGQNARLFWRLGVWSDTTGYPSVVNIYQDRMFFGNVRGGALSGTPDRFDFSESAGFSFDNLYMAPTLQSGLVDKTSAGYGELPGSEENAIQWFSPTLQGMLVGTSGSEYQIQGSGNNTRIEPDTFIADPISTTRSYPAFAVRAGTSTLYVQYSGRGIYGLTYSFQYNQTTPVNHSLTFEHLLNGYADGGGVNPASISFQYNPDRHILWCAPARLSDCVGMTFETEQRIQGGFRVNYTPVAVYDPEPVGQWRVPDLQAAPSRPLDILAVDVLAGGSNLTSVSDSTTSPSSQRPLVLGYAMCLQAFNGEVYDTYPEVGGGVAFDENFIVGPVNFKRVPIPCFLDYSLLRPLRHAVIPELSVLGDSSEYFYVDGCHHLNTTGFIPGAEPPLVDKQKAQVLIVRADGTYFWHPDVAVGAMTSLFLPPPLNTVSMSGAALLDPTYFTEGVDLENWRVYIGIQSPARIKTMPFGALGPNGVLSGLLGTLNTCKLRLENSLGVKFGTSDDDLKTWSFGQAIPISTGAQIEMFTGDTDNLSISSESSTYSQGYFVFDTPFQMFITQLLLNYTLTESL